MAEESEGANPPPETPSSPPLSPDVAKALTEADAALQSGADPGPSRIELLEGRIAVMETFIKDHFETRLAALERRFKGNP